MATKAETLKLLRKKKSILGVEVPKFIFFSKKSFLQNKAYFFFKIIKIFKHHSIIIRSSTKNEDTKIFSNAGKYQSVRLKNYDTGDLEKAIEKVINKFPDQNDQVIVQDLVEKADYSGVIFTKNINTGAPYYIINYDSSGKTDVITSGKKEKSIKTLIIYKKKIEFSKKFKQVLKKIKRIEKLFKNDSLDLEFAFKKKRLIIFQCRPLIKKNFSKNLNLLEKKIDGSLVNIKKKFLKLKQETPGLVGNNNFFSNMSDWNPAEMIGVKPSILSLSLYSELITDEAWAIQRQKYGYKDVRPNPLMVTLAGSPYIDLRVDFNSFMPANLTENIQKKIINYAFKKLAKKTDLHDKIEFKLLETCYDIETKKNISKFLNKKESSIYLKSLKKITNSIISDNALFLEDLKKIKLLNKEFNKILNSKISHIQKIYFLVKNCKKNGTIPFAGIARCAFVATKLLRSLNKKKLLSDKELQSFYSSIDSVTTDINNQFFICKKKKNFSKFLDKYGHIRPSTYSINSKNYRENYKNYFGRNTFLIKKKKTFLLSSYKIKNISLLFKKHGLKFNAIKFFNFAKKAIYFRELSKLEFTKSIDQIFKLIKNLSKEISISQKDLENISIKEILYYFNNLEPQKLKKTIRQRIEFFKEQYKITDLIEFPSFIKKESDFYIFEKKNFEGNFITINNCHGQILCLDSKKIKNKNLSNKIIILENADPGYDFIFSYKIKGLVTKYGGANSHMSIRCMELNIPALIGVGRFDYEKIKNANHLYLNCKDKFYKIIN